MHSSHDWFGTMAAGHPRGHPTLFPDYKNQMLKALDIIHSVTRHANIELFLRSIHYNSMKVEITGCPPKDWRSIPVINWYNKILKNITENTAGLTYLDTSSIIGPVWDSAEDYSHYENDAGKAETLYILREVTGMNH